MILQTPAWYSWGANGEAGRRWLWGRGGRWSLRALGVAAAAACANSRGGGAIAEGPSMHCYAAHQEQLDETATPAQCSQLYLNRQA